jgi:L-alanine-DL-glutamate epimerase-like enolase superfamily enzyme
MTLTLAIETRAWPMREPFAIARGVQTDQPTINVTLTDDQGRMGRGEGCGVDYDGETPETMTAELEALRPQIEGGVTREDLLTLLPAGGARCALDAALWDLEARQTGVSAFARAGVDAPHTVSTTYTIGIRTLADYEATARRYAKYRMLKIKVDGDDPVAAIEAVRRGAPDPQLIVDANQSWTVEALKSHAERLSRMGVVLLEQPIKVGAEAGLDGYRCPIPMAADELINDRSDLDKARGRFDVINIKLDKTGGLTEALRLADAARAAGFDLMVGCMAGSSLSMAPAMVLAQQCRFVDLDGPLLQSEDFPGGLTYVDGEVSPPERSFWG